MWTWRNMVLFFNKDGHMRNGTSLLLLALLASAACILALGPSQAMAAALEPTDSGAPSAIVIFPVGEKTAEGVAAMPPVAFNHYIHEKWMARAGKDCMVCHHTGDPIACTSCHTVEGKKEGGGVTLEQAMHAVKIKKRAENTPSSCVNCHDAQLKQRECAGCHTQLVKNVRNDEWCAVCHVITPSMTPEQLRKGIAGTLPYNQNEALAAETEKARKEAKYWSPMAGPYKVDIDTLAGKYMPVKFNHRHHVSTLMDRIKNNELANAFHTVPATICVTCHHNSPPSKTPPKCVSCHAKTAAPDERGRPGLMAAFHLQCMNCHTDMKVARPRNTDCDSCHKPRPAQTAAN